MSKSIISNEKQCMFCNTTVGLHKHHIFGGPNRKNSETYGCWCWLCHKHHTTSKKSVHHNREMDLHVKEVCQRQFEKIYDHEFFMEVFGKNYI